MRIFNPFLFLCCVSVFISGLSSLTFAGENPIVSDNVLSKLGRKEREKVVAVGEENLRVSQALGYPIMLSEEKFREVCTNPEKSGWEPTACEHVLGTNSSGESWYKKIVKNIRKGLSKYISDNELGEISFRIGVKGSAITGYKFTKGREFNPFLQSDLDFFIISTDLFNYLKDNMVIVEDGWIRHRYVESTIRPLGELVFRVNNKLAYKELGEFGYNYKFRRYVNDINIAIMTDDYFAEMNRPHLISFDSEDGSL